MTPHDLIRHGPGQYECAVCGQTWHSRPKAKCPELKVYPNHHYLPLMTREQLGYIGYQTSEKALPSPVGCYYSHATGTYVKLYDPARAIKRQGQPRRRTRRIIVQVTWPVTLLPLLDMFCAYLKDRILYNDGRYGEHVNEVANMIAQFAVFTPDEIERLAGPSIHLPISPSLARHYYPSFQANEREEVALASRVAAAYERQKTLYDTSAS